MTLELGGVAVAILTLLAVVFNAGVMWSKVGAIADELKYVRNRLDKYINGKVEEH